MKDILSFLLIVLINFTAIYFICCFIAFEINLFDDIANSENIRIIISLIFFIQLFFYHELKKIIKLK